MSTASLSIDQPMIRLRRPEPYEMREFLADQASGEFTYSEVGATQKGVAADSSLRREYFINHHRRRIGAGAVDFATACGALQSWAHLRLRWVDCWPQNVPMRAGEHIAVVGRALGLWWLNACRISYTIDERGSTAQFGYAHGTLGPHLAIGEERFLVEMTESQEVWIDVLSFSRPGATIARLGYPVMKAMQRRFASQSAAAISALVEQGPASLPKSPHATSR